MKVGSLGDMYVECQVVSLEWATVKKPSLGETTMTVQSQVSAFIPSDYDIFAGLDVDKGSIAMTFSNHKALLKSLRLPYSSEQLLNYVRKHFPEQRVVFVYEAGPTGFGLHDDLVANNHPPGSGVCSICEIRFDMNLGKISAG